MNFLLCFSKFSFCGFHYGNFKTAKINSCTFQAVNEAIHNNHGHGTVFQNEIKTGKLYSRITEAFSKERTANGIVPGVPKPLPPSTSEDPEEKYENTISNDYGDLKYRDPEVYNAVVLLDKAIALLSAKKGKIVLENIEIEEPSTSTKQTFEKHEFPQEIPQIILGKHGHKKETSGAQESKKKNFFRRFFLRDCGEPKTKHDS